MAVNLRPSGDGVLPHLTKRTRPIRIHQRHPLLSHLRVQPHRRTCGLRLASAAVEVQEVASAAAHAAAAAPLGAERSSTAVEPVAAPFMWTSHWWPLLPEAYLRPERPNPVTLLGIPMVVWRDGADSWRVFKDQCPHRLAPLSEGRLEADGTLSCSYHGWRFGGSGACSRIPQAVDASAEAAACSSRRSCATAYPVKMEAGMLWVWPDAAPDAAATAAATAVLISNDLRSSLAAPHAAPTAVSGPTAASGCSSNGSGAAPATEATSAQKAPPGPDWFMRELPYSYEVLLENLTDPAHLPFSHHGLTPNLQRSKGGPMPMQPHKVASAGAGAAAPEQPAQQQQWQQPAAALAGAALPPSWARPSGPDFEYGFVGNISPDAKIGVHMPHLVVYSYKLGPTEVLMELYAAPIAPGRSRFFTVNKPSPAPSRPPLHKMDFKKLIAFLPAMIDPKAAYHIFMANLLDGDSVFLKSQDEVLREVEADADAEALRKQLPAADDSAATVGGSGGGSVWSRAYYLPTPADSCMLAGRKWLEERAGGGPFRARQRQLLAGRGEQAAAGIKAAAVGKAVPGGAPTPEARRRVLDRYEQHTRHCPVCLPRLEQLQRLAAAAKTAHAVCLLGVCVAGGALGAAVAVKGAAAAVWPAALVAVFAALWLLASRAGAAAQSWAQKFMFQDYVHAEKD